MRGVIKKILKEGVGGTYMPCNHFTDTNENELCNKIHSLSGWLHSDSGLGLKNIINDKLSVFRDMGDVTEKYQEPLKILYDTGKFNNIEKVDDKYIHKGMIRAGLVYDESGEWHHVNKLNTNYSDLSELLTELLKRGGMVEKLNTKDKSEVKEYLITIKGKLSRVMDKYFNTEEYKEFIRNTRNTTDKGDVAEKYVERVLNKFGMNTVYQGGNGDFVDMIFGVDLIIDYKGNIRTIQIKNSEKLLEESRYDRRYRNIDYFISPTNFGVMGYNRKGDKFMIDSNGQLIK